MNLRDRDLISIQEARELAARAAAAQKKFSSFSQQQVDAVVEACAKAAAENAEPLARAAVEETGFGNVPDKIIKNTLAAVHLPRAIREMRTVGVLREDREKGIVEVASPVGVVAAVVPVTNPTSTAIYKTLISVKAQNAIVLSPHPSAIQSICRTATVLERAALAAGAPEGLIGCMQHTTLEGTRELMRQREVGVILATGGTGLVRAAYGSGKPAYGVGPGNVPAFIERTAEVRKAVADIFAGKTFDYGTICSSEQAIVADQSVSDAVLEECRNQGAYFLSAEEAEKVGRLVIQPGSSAPNPKIVGRHAVVIAKMAGIQVPAATRVLIARLEPEQVGRAFPLSAEKLSPVLAFYAVPNFAAGVELCHRLLEFGGLGHTVAIHSQDHAAIVRFGQAVPAFRVVVNTSAVHGSIGYSTNLFPAMTLGCGAPGGNITSDNIGPQHLMNIKRIAWESRGVEHRTIPAEQRLSAGGSAAAPVTGSQVVAATAQERIPEPVKTAPAESPSTSVTPKPVPVSASSALPHSPGDVHRAAVAQLVQHVMAERGIKRGSRAIAPQPAAKAKELPTPAAVAAEVAGRLFGSSTKPQEQPAPASRAASGETQPAEATAQPPSAPEGKPAATAAAPAIEISVFVSENDVRRALTRNEKIFIGRKTILTPSARDLGVEHEVFIETEAGSLR